MIVGRFYELELLNIHLLSQRKRSSMAWQLEFEAVQKQQRLDVEALSQDIIQILCKGRRKFEIFDRRQKLVNELIFYVKNTLLFSRVSTENLFDHYSVSSGSLWMVNCD